MATNEAVGIALVEAVEASVGEGEPVAVGFSGGLDSSLLALLLLRRARPTGYVVGTPGSHDIAQATTAAEVLGLPLRVIPMEANWVEENLPVVAARVPDMRTAAFELPLYRLAGAVGERVLVTGQGADEIFGGYHRYTRVRPADLEATLRADVEGLLREGYPRERALVALKGRELRCPYLHPAVVAAGLAVPIADRLPHGVRKAALREVAVHLGLPRAIATREKKAVQYGSGTARLLRQLARTRGTG